MARSIRDHLIKEGKQQELLRNDKVDSEAGRSARVDWTDDICSNGVELVLGIGKVSKVHDD